jgi:hypothetical protein
VEELVRRLPIASQEAAAQEQQIENTARSFIRLSQDTLANLRTGARQALELANHLDQERQQAETRLQEALTRQQQAEADLQKLTFHLRPHLAADRAIAQATAVADTTHGILLEAERLLQQADEALRLTLKTQAETQKLDKLYLTGEEARHDRSL